MAFPNSLFDQIKAITNDHFMPKMPQLMFDQHPIFTELHKKGTTAQGGDQIRQPVRYQFTRDGSYSPYQKLPTNAEDQHTAATYNWKLYSQHWAIADSDIKRNEGPEGIFKTVKIKTEDAAMAIRDQITEDMFYVVGIATTYGDTDTQINSLPNLLGDTTFVTGTTTAGNIDKSSNTFWRGTNTDYAAATLGTITTMLDAWYAIVDGNHAPKLIVSHPSVLKEHQQEAGLPSGGERFVNTEALNTGFTSFTFQGRPWITDRHVVDSAGSAVQLYMLDTEFIDLVSHKNRNFEMEDFQKPIDQDARVARIYWMGNLTTSDPSRSGVMYT